MLRLASKITITKTVSGDVYVFKFVNDFKSVESYDNLTDTCEVTLPSKLSFAGKDLFSGDNPVFERDDQIKIELGYFPNTRTIFEGWISVVTAKTPMVIKCQDAMYLLKNNRITFPSKRTIQTNYICKSGKLGRRLKKPKVIIDKGYTLDEMLNIILPDDIDYECDNVFLGKTAYTDCSVSRILEDLRSNLGLYSYFKKELSPKGLPLLHVGLPTNAADTNTIKFIFEEWIIDDSNLEWQKAEDIQLKVVVKLIGDNNTIEEYTAGDVDGAQRTIPVYWNGEGTKPDLKFIAENELKSKRYDGFRGSFKTFGEPYVRAGDVVQLVSRVLPERNGNYTVGKVEREFGAECEDGYAQEIHLDGKAS